jgi:hypothetical protein
MRRIILAVSVGAVLLTGAACARTPEARPSANRPTTDVATTIATPTIATPTEAAPPTEIPSFVSPGTESTGKVCRKVDKLMESNHLKAFSVALGRMITAKEESKSDVRINLRVRLEQADAAKHLLAVASQIEKASLAAKDPKVQVAGELSADAMRETVSGNDFFAKVDSVKDLKKNVRAETRSWVLPLATFCPSIG